MNKVRQENPDGSLTVTYTNSRGTVVVMNISKENRERSSNHLAKTRKDSGSSWNKGINHTEEAREKMREAWRNRSPEYVAGVTKRLLDATKDKPNPMKGKHHSEETKKNLSQINKGRPSPTKGTKHTEETKEKMREAWEKRPHVFSDETRKKMSDAKQGEKNWFYGKKHSEETKQKVAEANRRRKGQWKQPPVSDETKRKMSVSAKKRIRYPISEETRKKVSGANSVHWKGGRKEWDYGPDWNNELKRKIRNRDNKTCMLCHKPTRVLDVHHIVPFRVCYNNSIYAHNIENLISLCRSCHTKSEKKWKETMIVFRNMLAEVYGYTY